jgi:lipopolysaccharide/colanic/teichoic acid biosynthesis glycosyltransferase
MLKRMFDIFFSFIGIVLISPVILIVSLFILIFDGRPIFFLQERIGRYQVPFKIIKFRTMKNNSSIKNLITVGNKDPRVTNLGFYLRKYKIDEMPQLFNVLIGQMSFVGPRPEVLKYVSIYNESQKRVFLLRPGITDEASIKFRNESEILMGYSDPEKGYIEDILPQKLEISLKYLENSNIFYDISIILSTLKFSFLKN